MFVSAQGASVEALPPPPCLEMAVFGGSGGTGIYELMMEKEQDSTPGPLEKEQDSVGSRNTTIGTKRQPCRDLTERYQGCFVALPCVLPRGPLGCPG